MLTDARYAYNEGSTLLVWRLLIGQCIVAATVVLIELVGWALGAQLGVYGAVRPILAASLLPGQGWALGVVVSTFAGDGSDNDGPYRTLGNALGQIACLVAMPGALWI